MNLRFLGAAGEVTGSCYLVDTGALKFLVDCGMFQGGGSAERKNRRFAFKPRDIAFVLLSHAHIDHSGLLPRLAAQGFSGPIYATSATDELLAVMLPDSAHLQEREGERDGAAPLYTVAEAQASLGLLRPADYGVAFHPHEGLSCVFRDAGHILGSAIIEIFAGGKKIVFSGDLGQPGRPIVEDPTPIAEADVLLVESTYGDRIRHHLRYNISRPECAVVFVGFQAAGTLGRRIVDGAKSVRIFRENYPVRAKLFTINGLSAHADRDALLGWIGQFRHPPGQTWVVHGEPLAAEALKNSIIDGFGWRAAVPVADQVAAL